LTKEVSKATRSSNKAIGANRGEKSGQLEMGRKSQLLTKSLRNPKRSAANIYATTSLAASDIVGECDADTLGDKAAGEDTLFKAKASLTNTASFQTSNLSEGKSSICNNFAEARDTLGPLSTDPQIFSNGHGNAETEGENSRNFLNTMSGTLETYGRELDKSTAFNLQMHSRTTSKNQSSF
jgi:hypothetical protein